MTDRVPRGMLSSGAVSQLETNNTIPSMTLTCITLKIWQSRKIYEGMKGGGAKLIFVGNIFVYF